MTEPKDVKPWRCVPQAEFDDDLNRLANNELRKKYWREANSHKDMKSRCKGGAFELDPEWSDFRPFLKSMGPKGSAEDTLDRTDSTDRVYGPDRVKWADKKAQTDNRSNSIRIVFSGQSMSLGDFAKQIGKPYGTVYHAYKAGKTPEEIAGPRRSPKLFPGTAWRHPVPNLEPALAHEFERWKSKVNRSHKHYKYIDVFYFLGVLNVYLPLKWKVLAVLEEMVSEDEEAYRTSEDYEAFREMSKQLRYTLSCIAERDPALAARFNPENPSGWRWVKDQYRAAIQPEEPYNS